MPTVNPDVPLLSIETETRMSDSEVVAELRNILYQTTDDDGNVVMDPDLEWSPTTLDAIGSLMERAGLVP